MPLEDVVKVLNQFEDKSAYALCIFAYCKGSDHEPIIFEGRCDGQIVSPRGPSRFGWDPIFEPVLVGKTFAEMSKEEKNSVSHRSKAFQKLHDFLISSN